MMTIQQITKDMRAAMDKGIESTRREFTSIRSGKAAPNMLDTVRVDMYGTSMALNQVAQVSAPEPRLLIVTPFDKSQAKAIEKAIRESDLGLDPSSQGAMIRVPLPSMNEQRRKELVKVVHKLAEEGRLARGQRLHLANQAVAVGLGQTVATAVSSTTSASMRRSMSSRTLSNFGDVCPGRVADAPIDVSDRVG